MLKKVFCVLSAISMASASVLMAMPAANAETADKTQSQIKVESVSSNAESSNSKKNVNVSKHDINEDSTTTSEKATGEKVTIKGRTFADEKTGISLKINDVTGNIGTEVEIPVYVSGIKTKSEAYSISAQYLVSGLSYNGVEGGYNVVNVNADNDIATVGEGGIVAKTDRNGLLYTLKFNITGNSPTISAESLIVEKDESYTDNSPINVTTNNNQDPTNNNQNPTNNSQNPTNNNQNTTNRRIEYNTTTTNSKSSSDSAVRVEIGNISVDKNQVGEDVNVPVTYFGPEGSLAFICMIEYDEKLQYESSGGGEISGSVKRTTGYEGNNYLSIGGSSKRYTVKNGGKLFYMKFKLPEHLDSSANKTLSIKFRSSEYDDDPLARIYVISSDGTEYRNVNLTDGGITVTDGTSTTENSSGNARNLSNSGGSSSSGKSNSSNSSNSSSTKSPQTSDASMIALTVIFVLSGAAIFVAVIGIKKKRS